MENSELKRPAITATTLATLSYDVLYTIVTHIPDARSLAALSRTCKSLHNFVATDGHGWQIFVQSRFPSIYPSLAPHEGASDADANIDWRKHAEELTLLSRNYDRRGFVARILNPKIFVPHPWGLRHREGRGSHLGTRWEIAHWDGRQTIGFRPVLDTCDDVLAVGAGQDLLVRKKGSRKEELWWEYEDRAQAAGRDDVTALRLFRGADEHSQRALVGRANGTLACVVLQTVEYRVVGAECHVETVLETRGKVRSAALLERRDDTLVASVMGNDAVVLHKLPSQPSGCSETVPIASELAFLLAEEQPWTVEFLSPRMLAVGKNSVEPCVLHSVIPYGLSATPTYRFSAEACVDSKISSVQSIATLPDMRASDDLFLAGWYTGATLLHDLRSPKPYAASFTDPLDTTSPVYSLLPIGRERVLVGGARNDTLKVFDIRMPGGRVYAYPGSSEPPPSIRRSRPSVTPGWATYIRDGFYHRNWGYAPVYSLASGSPGGAQVFAGVEDAVWGFDFASERGGGGGGIGLGQRLSAMYEFSEPLKLWKQGAVEGLGCPGKRGEYGILDGRWRA